ncbi:MAG: right-handed parallel beta-helix repeat-containing protein [Gemmatimonadaceae bacterium]|nr:right-handed parallel beta-helix repeat-containing protein [Gemmatimonadaceae bacterium]
MIRLRPAPLVAVVIGASASLAGAQGASRTIPLTPGMVITESVRIRPGVYRLPAPASLDSALVVVRGSGVVVDMRGVRLEGTAVDADPDQAAGVAVRIDGGDGVDLRGATIRGYRIAVLARGARRLTLRDNDLSHNWKPRLFSQVGHESLVDWLSFHQNEKREWMRFGAAIYLEDVQDGVITGNTVEQGMNALLMTRSDGNVIERNTFAFNSGLGIGMYRSSANRIIGNRIDYNVRGYSHGWYRRGQDSAGLLMYEQSSRNVVAWNSVTHGGDGLFLWAGQSTMDSGEGGANDNLYFGNDFSFAPTNGIEATFSRNRFIANVVEGNDHGVWGGYSFESAIVGNCFARNRIGVAIEHGQDNTIARNAFRGDTTALYLWANAIEPGDWVYPKKRDTRSRDYRIVDNRFAAHQTVWRVTQTAPLDSARNTVGTADSGCDPRDRLGAAYDSIAATITAERASTPRAIPAAAWPRRDRSAIVVDEWGPFDWRSPKLWPADTMQDAVPLRTLGPAGRWRIVAMEGVRGVSARAGRIGDTLVVRPQEDREHDWVVTLEYVGAATRSPRGVRSAAGVPVRFAFERRAPRTDWRVRYFAWTDTLQDPPRRGGNLEAILAGTPLLERRDARLDHQWFRPRFGLPQERWALEARATIDVPAGAHLLRVISDDAARVIVDGATVAERREPGGSEVMYAGLTPGKHDVVVQYYQLTGWTELRVDVVRGTNRSTGSAGPH